MLSEQSKTLSSPSPPPPLDCNQWNTDLMNEMVKTTTQRPRMSPGPSPGWVTKAESHRPFQSVSVMCQQQTAGLWQSPNCQHLWICVDNLEKLLGDNSLLGKRHEDFFFLYTICFLESMTSRLTRFCGFSISKTEASVCVESLGVPD